MRILCTDLGLYPEQCNALADGGKNEVLYYTDWANTSPTYSEYAVGKGFEYLKKILYFWDYVESADMIVNFDVINNDAIAYLRKKYPQKSIIGCGRGERLENDRKLLKEWIKELGLPENPYVVIQGVKKLREYLKENKDKFVKVNIFRKDVESFYAKDLESVELIIDQIEGVLGMHKDSYEFVVENAIHTDVECGVDVFFNGSNFIKPYIYGYEISKGLYVGRVSDELPKPLEETLEAFAPLLNKLEYRGPISTEEKILSLKEHYFLDFCARLPNPLSALYPVMIENWADAIFKIGKGEDVEFDIKHKYVGAFPLVSLDAEHNYVKVDIEPKYRDRIRYQMVCSKGKNNYAVKGWSVVAILVAGGETVDEVIDSLKDSAKHVTAYSMDTDPVNAIDIAKDVINAGKKIGIKF